MKRFNVKALAVAAIMFLMGGECVTSIGCRS